MRLAALTALVLCTTALAPLTASAAPRRTRRESRVAALNIARRAEPLPEDRGARRARALELFARSGHIRRCWMQQLQRDATSTSRTLTFRLSVDSAGRFQEVVVTDPAAPRLARCLAAGAWSLGGLGVGEALQAEGTLHLDRGE